MDRITRRRTLALGAGTAIASGIGSRLGGIGSARAAIPEADVAQPSWPIEQGATLRIVRPTKFVDADEPLFRENSRRFSDKYKVPVRVDFVDWEDLRPQTAVSANTGAGPDVVIGWPDDPHIYARKLRDLSDVTGYLGRKYGGWYFLAEKYGKEDGSDRWIGMPMGASGAPAVYRISWVKEAGFDGIPDDLDQFLQLCRKLKANGHPPGFALGNAVGDANGYCSWLLWSHGGSMVDEDGHVSINSKATIEALKYSQALFETMISGTLSWNDSSNNKAFEAEQISLTQNGVSIYYAMKQNRPEIGADVGNARMPRGVAATAPESALMLNAMIFDYCKYPNAAKQYLAFMMEAPQYDRWLIGSAGYWSQPLRAYADSEVWQHDPKIAAYKTTSDNRFWNGYKGPITAAAGAVQSDYVLVHMFAAVASGQATPEEAAKEAERRAQHYYKA